jgi:hypothetical protein
MDPEDWKDHRGKSNHKWWSGHSQSARAHRAHSLLVVCARDNNAGFAESGLDLFHVRDCTNPNTGFNLVRTYYQWFQNYSSSQPEYLPEFEGGWFSAWGGTLGIQTIDIDGTPHILVVRRPAHRAHSLLVVCARDNNAGFAESGLDRLERSSRQIKSQMVVRSFSISTRTSCRRQFTMPITPLSRTWNKSKPLSAKPALLSPR